MKFIVSFYQCAAQHVMYFEKYVFGIHSEINTEKEIYIVGAWARNKEVNRQIQHPYALPTGSEMRKGHPL